jgi:DNA-binding NarL/FixJ family response regulator
MRARFDRDPAAAREALVSAARGLDPSARRTVLSGVSREGALLIVFAAPAVDLRAKRLETIVARYELTPRQAEVLRMLVRGASNRAIAGSLDCAERTVEIHVTAILAKLDVESRSAAVARVFGDD